MRITDQVPSVGSEIVADELGRDEYGLERIDFSPDDVVVDIGGHVGMFAIYLAKQFPFLRILSFEPLPSNYGNFVTNLSLNQVSNVEVANLAVTSDGRRLRMVVHPSNTAGATANLGADEVHEHLSFEVDSVSLEDIFLKHGLDRVKLLKVDCEGCEYEVLLESSLLERVEYLSAEFHVNDPLERQGYSALDLLKHCEKYIDPAKISFKTVQMQGV